MTLAEIMVGTVIFSMMMAGVYTAFAAGNRSWSTYENNIALQRDVRGSILAMVPELREASGITITQSSGSSTISFATKSLASVSYSWTNTGANAKKLIRTVGSTSRTLASNISALSFTNSSGTILVDLTATKTPTLGAATSFNLKEKVTVR